jgi:hypothetical protein
MDRARYEMLAQVVNVMTKARAELENDNLKPLRELIRSKGFEINSRDFRRCVTVARAIVSNMATLVIPRQHVSDSIH